MADSGYVVPHQMHPPLRPRTDGKEDIIGVLGRADEAIRLYVIAVGYYYKVCHSNGNLLALDHARKQKQLVTLPAVRRATPTVGNTPH